MTTVAADQMAVFEDPAWRADLALLAESTRIAARGYAADAFTLVDLAAQVPEPVGTGAGALPWLSFLREVAVARGLQDGAAAHEVALATVLVRCMPRTLEMLACGAVTVSRATALADELLDTTVDVAHAVDRIMWPRLAAMAPERVRRAARREVDRLDPDAACDRAARATAGRGVRFRSEKEGQASADVRGPAVALRRWHTALTEAALAQQAAGDPRSLDALRFDLLVAGFTCSTDAPTPRPFTASPAPEPEPEDLPPALMSREQLAALEGGQLAAPEAIPSPPPESTPAPQPDPESSALQPEAPTTFDLPACDRTPPTSTPEAPPTSAAPPTPDLPPDRWPVAPETTDLAPPPTDDATAEQVLLEARAAAARLLHDARASAERVLEAAHHAEADALDRITDARAEVDRLVAQAVRERLAASERASDDRRHVRPVQLLVHVPITTLLGLANEPGWLDGYGWIDAPQCRQLLPLAELRQVCVGDAGQVVDLAPRVVRPEPTPTGARAALVEMATRPFDITDAAWRATDAHDPPDAMADFVRVRDRFCDGPLGTMIAAANSDLDHGRSWPDGPTAPWNLVVRSRRSHRMKHAGWVPMRTAASTLWTSPAGQLADSPHQQLAVPPLEPGARLVDPDALHVLEAELLRPPDEA